MGRKKTRNSSSIRKSKFEKFTTPKKLVFFATLLIVSAIIGQIIIYAFVNPHIANLENDLQNASDAYDRADTNLGQNSNEFEKASSTYGAYLILDALNSSSAILMLNQTRQNMYMSIVILRGKQFDSSDREWLDSLSGEQLDQMVDQEFRNLVDKANIFKKQKEDLRKQINAVEQRRDFWNFVFLTLQTLGVLLVTYAEYKSQK
jgi:frataxin-like iron-binding protein CyaY